MRQKMDRMQHEVNEFVAYVKREMAHGLGEWEERLGTALVKSPPTSLVRGAPPVTAGPSAGLSKGKTQTFVRYPVGVRSGVTLTP